MPAKKILIISGVKVFPAESGGHLRTSSIAKALARLGYKVHLYSFAGRREHYKAGKPPYLVEDVEPGLIEETHLGWGIGLIQAFFRRLGVPRVWQFEMMRRGWIPSRMKKAMREADLIIADRPFVPIVPGPWRSKPWILLSHNLEFELLAAGPPADQARVAWMKKIETAAPAQFEEILACAESDQTFFQSLDGDRRMTIPIIRCGVDAKAYQMAEGVRERVRGKLGVAPDERLLIFTGSAFGPNITALVALKAFFQAHEAWLREARIRLLIAGSMEKQPGRDGVIIITGSVPEMLPYFAAADAGLNPVTTGSGANVKLFEYLAARLTVISTPFGVRGSELVPGQDYIEYDPANPLPALETYAARDIPEWRRHAETVWQRHREHCEIQDLTRAAIAQLPLFELHAQSR